MDNNITFTAPKFVPGTVVIALDSQNLDQPVMFTVASAFYKHEEWHYEDSISEIQMHESEIVAVINNSMIVDAQIWNGPTQTGRVETSFATNMASFNQAEQDYIDELNRRKTPENKKTGKAGYPEDQSDRQDGFICPDPDCPIHYDQPVVKAGRRYRIQVKDAK